MALKPILQGLGILPFGFGVLAMQKASAFKTYDCFTYYQFEAIDLVWHHEPAHYWPMHIKITVDNVPRHIIPIITLGLDGI